MTKLELMQHADPYVEGGVLRHCDRHGNFQADGPPTYGRFVAHLLDEAWTERGPGQKAKLEEAAARLKHAGMELDRLARTLTTPPADSLDRENTYYLVGPSGTVYDAKVLSLREVNRRNNELRRDPGNKLEWKLRVKLSIGRLRQYHLKEWETGRTLVSQTLTDADAEHRNDVLHFAGIRDRWLPEPE